MKDKLKGMIIGMSVGVMLSGSIAFADSAQIDVVMKKLKFMFDGKEIVQPDDQQNIVYDGTTYVPIRFLSEALGKDVNWDPENETIWIGKYDKAVVATYKGGTVTWGELSRYVSVISFLDPSNKPRESTSNYKENLLRQMISYRVLSDRATDDIKNEVTPIVDEHLKQIKEYFASQSTVDFAGQLKDAGLQEDDLKQYITGAITAQKVLELKATDERLQSLYDYSIKFQKGEYTMASVRHILIGFTDSDGKARSKDDALKRAQEVEDKLKNGADFAKLAGEYSDDPGSKQNGGLYENAPVNNWVAPFRQAALTLELNQVSDPVETDYGYHVMRVELRKNMPFEEVKDELKAQTVSSEYNSFMGGELNEIIQNITMPK